MPSWDLPGSATTPVSRQRCSRVAQNLGVQTAFDQSRIQFDAASVHQARSSRPRAKAWCYTSPGAGSSRMSLILTWQDVPKSRP